MCYGFYNITHYRGYITTEQLFLKLCNVKEVLDEGELWQEYKDNAIKQGDPIKYYKSSNGLYFFQTAGFEFIFS
jgi:hypothetical protein